MPIQLNEKEGGAIIVGPADEELSTTSVLNFNNQLAVFGNEVRIPVSDDTGAWVSQDWSRSAGLRLWFYGAGSGSSMFVDLLDNRNPGSTVDDAERWTTEFVDDVDGWRLLEIPFSSLTRKEIGDLYRAVGM